MKKIFHLILVMAIATMFFSCMESETSVKNRIYAEKHAIYTQGDSLYTGITTYIAYPGGHKTMYHVFSGKNKSQMEVWHMEKECALCKKLNK